MKKKKIWKCIKLVLHRNLLKNTQGLTQVSKF
jgi:hypothetical protein